MKPEEKIVLSLSVLNPSPGIVRSVVELLRGDSIDFDRIFASAAKNEVAPMVYENLRGFDNVPEEVMERFRNAYLHTVRNNVLNLEEMLRVLHALETGGVEVIPLKGSLASEILFGNPGLYPVTDLDVLVKPEEIKKAEAIVAEAGYVKNTGTSDEDLLTSHYHFVYRKDNHFIELHWNLAKRYFEVPPEFWWEEPGSIDRTGVILKTLSPERYLMYATFRLFDHGFRPLKFLVFVSGLLRKYEKEIDWEKLLRLSGKYRMERLIVFTIKLVHDLFGTAIHECIIRKQVRGYEFFRKKILAGIFGEVEKPHLRMFLYTLLLDNPGDFTRVIAKRFFPDMAEIRLRYGLSPGSRKAYAYYLMNPVLVLLKKR